VRDVLVQQLGRLADDARDLPGSVDRSVPRAAAQRLQISVTVTAQLLDLGKEFGVRLSAREDRDVVTACKRRFDDRAPEELRPAED
jgi:hypothetical protein